MTQEHRHVFDNWHVSLQQIGWELLTPQWWQFQLRAPHWRCYLHDRDGAMLVINGVRHPLRAHCLYFIPADTNVVASTETVVGQLFCHFQLLGLPTFTQRMLFDPVIDVPTPDLLTEWGMDLFAHIQANRPVDLALECRMKALIYAALGHTLDALPPERIARSLHLHANLQSVHAAIQYIDEHLEEPIRLAKLADLCTLTPVYFGRRFQQYTGMTPISYLQEVRVKAAMQHLSFTDLSIDEIAQRTGFGSRAYFSRVFARHAGKSPAAYRKALRT